MAENLDKNFIMSVSEMMSMISKAETSISEFGGSVSSVFDSFGQAGSSIESGVASLEKLAASTGSLKGAMDSLGSGEAFSNIGEVIQSFGGAIGGLSSMMSPFGQVISGAMSTLDVIPDGIAAIGESIIAKVAEDNEKLTTENEKLTESLQLILGKMVSFSGTFLSCMNFAAVLGLVTVGLGLLYQTYGEQIDQLLLMITEKGPMIITNLCNGIILALPGLIEQGALLLNGLMLAITANLPAIITGGIGIITALITGIAQQLPMLMPTALNMVLTLIQALLGSLPLLIDSGLQLLLGIVMGIVNSIPVLVAAIPTLIGSLVSGILGSIPQIIDTGIKLIFGMATGLIKAIPQIVGVIPEIIDSIKKAFREVDWLEVGTNIIKGVVSGVKSMASALYDVVKELAEKALNKIKDFLGINSPSRVFRDEVGKMMALGMGLGFKTNIPVNQMNKGIDNAIGQLEREAGRITSVGLIGSGSTRAGYAAVSQSAGFDFDEYERRQRKLNRERDDRPVFLNSRQINRALKKGEPVTV